MTSASRPFASSTGTRPFQTLLVTSFALGVPPHVVKEIAGHSDIKVTMTVYAHGHMEEKAAALTQLGTAMAGTLPSTVAVNEDAENGEDRPTSP